MRYRGTVGTLALYPLEGTRMIRIACLVVIAACLLLATDAHAGPLTLTQARQATVRGAERPSAFTEDNLPVGMPSVPRAWTASGGFCHRQPKAWHDVPTVHCWVRIDFPEWEDCHISDLWSAAQRGRGPIRVRSLHQWTTSSTACPGFGTMTIEPVSGAPQTGG